ncbi:hypothetical protein [Streptomyces fuscigenes]|uniref:hypothetical protein n=1 Tax=Streptomyces fuscigenes TaxID=1528880 RepID=UPI001F3E0D81|nr:hypothetical protein [Streptomyces fuscigenes]MCF3963938.1 hypothetical protein [Streptomyces fuscigenes]
MDPVSTITGTALADGELTEEQRRGAACAVCGTRTSTSGAVDLGRHHDPDGVRLFLRAHPECVPGAVA